MKLTIQDVDVKDIFNYNIEDRKKLVEEGVELFLQQTKIGALILNCSVEQYMDRHLMLLETEMEKARNNEEYEIVWYYNEIIWGIHTKRDGNWNI